MSHEIIIVDHPIKIEHGRMRNNILLSLQANFQWNEIVYSLINKRRITDFKSEKHINKEILNYRTHTPFNMHQITNSNRLKFFVQIES